MWLGAVRCRRTARREGEIQDDQRGSRLHVHRAGRLLGAPGARTARRSTAAHSPSTANQLSLSLLPVSRRIDQPISDRILDFLGLLFFASFFLFFPDSLRSPVLFTECGRRRLYAFSLSKRRDNFATKITNYGPAAPSRLTLTVV